MIPEFVDDRTNLSIENDEQKKTGKRFNGLLTIDYVKLWSIEIIVSWNSMPIRYSSALVSFDVFLWACGRMLDKFFSCIID